MKKKLRKTVYILIICFAGISIGVKYWIGPMFVCRRFEKVLSNLWEGEVRFKTVKFNLFGDQRIKGVTFFDIKGREWGHAGAINATLGNWPSRNYYVKGVNIDKLNIQLLMDTNKDTFPLKPTLPKTTKRNENAVLKRININSGSVNVVGVSGQRICLGDFFLSAKRKGDRFEISSKINDTRNSESVVFEGALGRGSLNLNNITGSFCGGNVEGNLDVDNQKPESPGIRGQFSFKDIELAKLAEKFGSPGKITTGRASLDYSFSGEGIDIEAISGQGFGAIDDADILPMPLLTKISQIIGLTDKEMKATSDAMASFESKGLKLVVDKAFITNPYQAIIIEQGGTIDLKNRSVDMYITATRLRQISSLVREIPVVQLFARFKDKLTRLRIKGRWSDPASKLIKKEPVNDVKEGVVNFFKETVRTGGQLTKPMVKRGQRVFERGVKE